MKPLLSRASPEPSVFRPSRSRSQSPVAPNLLVARTDSVHYYQITPDVYRFFPGVRDQTDIEAVHVINERLGTVAYLKAVQFMEAMMQGAC